MGVRAGTAKHRRLTLIALLLVVAVVLMPALALARAGGGQVGGGSSGGGSSSSGSHSSGSSSGGGSSDSGSNWSGSASIGTGTAGFSGSGDPTGGFAGLLCCGCPLIVTIALIVLIVSLLKKRGARLAPSVVGPVPPVPMSSDPYAPIKASDPDFSEELFLRRVNEMFIAIQYAWMARDMEPVRRFLADQQFTVLRNGVKEYVLNGTINMLGNVHITEMHPVEVTREGDFDAVKLLITAICIDYTINEATKEIVNPAELGDGKTPREFLEYWTFMRKSGAKTKADASIQKCPNCGAPVTDGNYVKCAYCGVQMNDPTLDWVLMRIEQV